ncbi:MAG: NUDIX domain-containing protein [Anaerolineae bacterium]|nr:NUDIX domain-containing protein [Anaerolineae bacterium]MCA9888705.1 NUDIX domain-containing protein [Anaerolineae bacterium]MCA9892067.1 NUDIX domain-containing protein [Anaerolineae bacterium]MCB9460204.1 NUDIX domain-containing protein [Anaerolineaceae bacterium]
MTNPPGYAPRDVFEQMLEWMVIPTFDLVLSYGEQGVIIVRRKIAPYKDVWALPGLRMYKGEDIDDTLRRIAEAELGLEIDASQKQLLGQYVGKFKSEHNRQDLSTGYHIPLRGDQLIRLNEDHFYSYEITRTIPDNMGAMYRHYLSIYFDERG